jgi:hypothetical protein
MATSCYITDYTKNVRSALFFKLDDFSEVIDAWEKQDALLVDLSQQVDMFANITRWCDLEPLHWQLILATNFRSIDALPEEDQEDMTNPTVASFHRMIMGLVLCLEERCQYAHVDTIKIIRTGELDCSYEFTISMMAIRANDGNQQNKPKPTFSVVVDNTDKK